jgi:hypothetical protein
MQQLSRGAILLPRDVVVQLDGDGGVGLIGTTQ